jgi:hypothetical protein
LTWHLNRKSLTQLSIEVPSNVRGEKEPAMRKWSHPFTVFLCISSALLSLVASAGPQVSLRLVSARNHIEGGFLGNQAVYADDRRIYLASFTGDLFVLSRDRAADFPVIEIVHDTSRALTAVRGDQKYIYVASSDGNLRVYRKGEPLLLVHTIPLSGFGLGNLARADGDVYAARGFAHVAASQQYLYLSALNEGDVALELPRKTLVPGRVFGDVFEAHTTVVFDRRSGDRVFALPTPVDVRGSQGGANLYADGKILVQTVPGCCGPGIFVYETQTFSLTRSIPRLFTNTVERRGRWLIGGNEAGTVDLFDLRQDPSPMISSVDLRQLTGHTGSEDIEIRALWTDHHDDLIFAGSSWGNDASRGPDLPSFFVLETAK